MGEKIYLPHSQQFDEMNANLAKIAKAIGNSSYTSSWKDVRNAVRAGFAPDLYPVGTQFVVHHETYGDHLYDVVAHDFYKSANNEDAHTMTLMCHDVVCGVPFDASEASYYVESDLPAGSYCVELPSGGELLPLGRYSFTLSSNVSKGSLICISPGGDLHTANSYVVRVYSGAKETEYLQQVFADHNVPYGTYLGVTRVELNDQNRRYFGSNNYKESAVRQFLNGSGEDGSFWKPQTKFDMFPSEYASLDGFLKGLDEEFLSVVGKVVVPCDANIDYESPDSETVKLASYTVNDLFYLPRIDEIVADDVTKIFPYYYGASSADRVKYYNGVPVIYSTRTPNRTCYNIQGVDTNGYTGLPAGPCYTNYIVPVCNIV